MLRKRYGINRIKTYYDPNSSDFHTFYDLIEEFENSLSDFEHYSNEVNDDFIKELNSLRRPSNAEAHSIETDISDEEMEDYQPISIHLTKVLFYIRDSL